MESTLLTKERDTAPYYHQLKRVLREKIESNELLPGDQIPSIAELIETYGVSKITVTKALSELSKEGFLKGRQGKGIFVRSAHAALTEKEVVGVVMGTTGHVYQSLSRSIIRRLMQHDLFPIVVDMDHDVKTGFHSLRTLIEKRPPFLIVDIHNWGISRQLVALLRRYHGHLILIHRFEGTEELPGTCVFSDLHRGGSLAAEHLLAAGYRRIIYYTGAVPDKMELPGLASVKEGVRSVLVKHGRSEDDLSHWFELTDKEQGEAALQDRLKRETMPIALIGDQDYRLEPVYRLCAKLGLRIPDDIGLVGWYNTPWCDMFRPGLTSLSMRDDLMAKKVLEVITNKGMQGKTILIPPELVIRESARRCDGQNRG